MKPAQYLIALFACVLLATACVPRVSDPAEFITVNKQRELQLLGSWKLEQLQDGRTPQSHEQRTLTFQNDGVMKMDLWEHEPTYKYEVMPDPDHLRLTWVASTNPNDKHGDVLTQSLEIKGDTLELGGDHFRRAALATAATLTPPAKDLSTPRATASRADVVSASLNKNFQLRVGQTAIVTDTPDQFGITFFSVNQDSRCPQGMTCVWAGEVRVNISFQENGLMHPPLFELTTTPNAPDHTVVIENYVVELVEVQPPKLAGVEIPPQDYIATFLITPAGNATPIVTPRTQTTPPLMVTPVAQVTASLDQPITLKMFETVEIPEAQLRVTMNGVLEDSRCPKQVDCVVAGRALMAFRVEHNDRLGFFELSTQPPDGRTQAYFQGYAIELQDVQPYPETPDQQIPATGYSATIVVRQAEPPTTVNKNQPFVLKPGQTATIEDENVTVTFVRVQSDSRCPVMVDCFVRGNAPVETILTQADGTQQTFILNTDSAQGTRRVPDTGDYSMELVALTPYPRVDIQSQDIAPDDYEATLVLRKFAPLQIPTPTRTALTGCLGLTKQDAEAILGEQVKAEPVEKVNIRVNPFDDESKRASSGLCGFVSVAEGMKDVIVAGDPQVDTLPALYAVTAASLKGEQTLELLRVANIVRGSKPDGETTPYLILLTNLAAGNWDGVFETIQQLPHDADKVHFESVDSFGDAGLWIWREAVLTNYAALVVREKDSFVVVEALLPKTMREAAAKESIHAAMEKMIQ